MRDFAGSMEVISGPLNLARWPPGRPPTACFTANPMGSHHCCGSETYCAAAHAVLGLWDLQSDRVCHTGALGLAGLLHAGDSNPTE